MPTPICKSPALSTISLSPSTPYYDGNVRTARLLRTFILHKGGCSLNGSFSLEVHHA